MAFDKTQDRFVGRESAWHAQGFVAGRLLTMGEIVANSDLQHGFRKEQRTNPYTGESIRSWDVFREDDTWIANVGERHTLLTVEDAFGSTNEMLTDLLGKADIYETGGTLENGAKRWMLASLGEGNVLGVDPIKKYLGVFDAVDGSMPFSIRPTDIRVVCRNTFMQASKAVATFVRKHSRNAGVDIVNHMATLRSLMAFEDAQLDTYNDLAMRAVQATEVKNIIRALFGVKADTQWDDVPTVTRNRVDNVFELFESNDGDAFPQFRGTAWNLFNAVTEYSDHVIDVRLSGAKASLGYDAQTARQYNALFGTGAELKQSALDLILEQTANAPRINGQTAYSFASQPANVLDSILDSIA